MKASGGLPKLLLLSFSLALGFVLLEAGLRIVLTGTLSNPQSSTGLLQAHPTRGWVLIPDAEGLRSEVDFRVLVKVNSQGLRDVEHSIQAEPGVFRIVIIGDSFMQAYQVQLEESLPRLLEHELRDATVEVINLGVGGYGTTQESIALAEDGLRYSPDLVVLAVYADNDVRNNSRPLEARLWRKPTLKTFGRPFAQFRNDKISISKPDFARSQIWIEEQRVLHAELPLLERLLAFDLGSSLLIRFQQSFGTAQHRFDPNLMLGVYATEFAPGEGADAVPPEQYEREWADAWNVTEAMILRARGIARESGARFAMFAVPSKLQVDSNYREQLVSESTRMHLDPGLPNRRLQSIAERADISFLDLQPAMLAHYAASGPVLYHSFRDSHWNAAGHAFSAREVASFLREPGLLKP